MLLGTGVGVGGTALYYNQTYNLDEDLIGARPDNDLHKLSGT